MRSEEENRREQPDATGQELVFVVQKHAATHLHYDLRLELDGVLKSWAIPKGPSLDPNIRRLAMQVEDHPYEYKDFEGIIPKGNYGAGEVIVWDQGSYRAAGGKGDDEAALREGLRKGDLKFILHGEKLKGEFALVRIKSSDDNSWLLLKKKDAFATSEEITRDGRSVVSGRELSSTPTKEPSPPPAGEGRHAGTAPQPMQASPAPTPGAEIPRNLKPMTATAVKEPFDSPDWLFELKLDGYRAVAEIDNGTVLLYSRNNLSYNGKFPPVVHSLRSLPGRALLDGEVVVLDDLGRPTFQLLQNYERTGRGNLVYFVFDLLHLNGTDLRELPLERRKEALRAYLPELINVRYTDHVLEEGTAFFELARQRDLEGLVAKRRSSRYYAGRRTREWLKIKIKQQQEAVVCGWTEPRGSRRYFGALVLGVYDQGEPVYIGLCGGGFDERTLGEVDSLLRPLVVQRAPFRHPPNLRATWVEPRLVCEVTFTEWTEEGIMRHPVFLGLREDKDPKSVRKEAELGLGEVLAQQPAEPPETEPPEQASPPSDRSGRSATTETKDAPLKRPAGALLLPATAKDRPVTIGGQRLSLTNLDKVFWPDEGYTKGDVINYYRRIAPFILPYLKDRPQSLYRTPEGIAQPGFYQKDTGDLPPDWMATKRIFSKSNDKFINFLLCQDEASLVYMANLGCIEINPWLSRVQSLDFPDFLVIDLDPEDIPFEKVVQTALVVRGVLDLLGVTGYPKTSGATGIHIYLPLGAQYDYDTAANFGRLIATLANNKAPDYTSMVRSPGKRQKRVYLDFLQNRPGQTIAAPYSLRARPGAPASTPLTWDEVAAGLHPSHFTIANLAERLERVGDLFAGVFGEGIDIAACIKRLGG